MCPTYSIHAARLRRCSRLIEQDWFSSVWPGQVSSWLWPHFWPCTTQVRSREERFLSSHSQLEAGNLNWLFRFFFHSALREIEFDPLLLEQVRLGGFVCLFGEKALKLSCSLSSLPACTPTAEAGSGTHVQDRAVP